MAEAYRHAIALADKIMSGRIRADLETTNFHIATDVFRDDVLQQLAGSLEGAYYTINKTLDLPIADTDQKVRVYFFEKRAQQYGLMGFSRGAYLSPGLLTFYKGNSATQELLDVLVHETTHAFLDQYIIKPDVKLPAWLNEGFAA